MVTMMLSAALLVLAGSTPAAQQSDPREQLSTAIAQGIKVLEARDYLGFLRNFLPPETAAIVLAQEPTRVAQKFGEEKGPRLLEALREAQAASPVYEDNGQTARCRLKTPIAGRMALTFVKVGKYWYLRD